MLHSTASHWSSSGRVRRAKHRGRHLDTWSLLRALRPSRGRECRGLPRPARRALRSTTSPPRCWSVLASRARREGSRRGHRCARDALRCSAAPARRAPRRGEARARRAASARRHRDLKCDRGLRRRGVRRRRGALPCATDQRLRRERRPPAHRRRGDLARRAQHADRPAPRFTPRRQRPRPRPRGLPSRTPRLADEPRAKRATLRSP